MNTLPDNRHFWKSLVSSVRNWNTTSPAPLGNHKPPSRLVKVPVPPEEGDRGPELSPEQHRSLSRPALAIPVHSPAAPSWRCWLRSVSTSPKPLEPEVSPGLGGTSAIRFLLSLSHPIPASTVSPPHPPRARAQGRPLLFRESNDPEGLWSVRDFTCIIQAAEGSERAEGFDGNR